MPDLKARWGGVTALRTSLPVAAATTTLLGEHDIDWAAPALGAFGGTVYLTLDMRFSVAGVQVRVHDRLGPGGAYCLDPYAEYQFADNGVHEFDIFNKSYSAIVIENLDLAESTGPISLSYRGLFGQSVGV